MAYCTRYTGVALLAAAFAACAPALAGEKVLHRSVLPDGSVIYGDAPAPGAQADIELRVEPHPADALRARRAQADLQQQQVATLRAYERRQARVAELDRMIADANTRFTTTRLEREQAMIEREGDRQGRRLTAQYVQRQADAAATEAAAARRLRGLEQERAALLP